ncbi:MAG TPA: hypothetical protein VHK67_03000 [Rhabdochlamydiaceae bacterium]|jgi:hypothetical protein|nr:hypothetical protein [Rhabdochlamydiaceae bacterium]
MHNTEEPPEANEPQIGLSIDPSWEKWRNEQVQTISSILSNVFRVEDEVRQIQAPSRLLRNPARQSSGGEKEICDKLNAIRKQISEYEQMLQLSLKRIDNALLEIHPQETPVCDPPSPPVKLPTAFERLKTWVKKKLTL